MHDVSRLIDRNSISDANTKRRNTPGHRAEARLRQLLGAVGQVFDAHVAAHGAGELPVGGQIDLHDAGKVDVIISGRACAAAGGKSADASGTALEIET